VDEANPRDPRSTRVGVFTLVGLLLVVLVLGAVTGVSWFEDRRYFVVFFPNPVGLREGAPVTFRQTPLGEVTDVELVFTGLGVQSEVQVVIAVRRRVLHGMGGESMAGLSDVDLANNLSLLGLRATVRSTSPLAGQKYLDLDFEPGVAARYSGLKDLPHPEIPTAPTDLEIIREKVEAAIGKIADVPLDEVLLQMQATLASTQRLLDQGDVEGSMKQLRSGLAAAEKLMGRAERSLDKLDGVADQVGATLGTADATLKGLDATLAKLDRTLSTVDRSLERTGDAQHEAVRNLDEMNELLRSLRQLVDTLQRNPEALLRGRPDPEEKR
jgi:paraquat-inducible protein B